MFVNYFTFRFLQTLPLFVLLILLIRVPNMAKEITQAELTDIATNNG